MTRVWHSSQTARAGLARGVRTDGKTSEEAEQQEQVMGTDKWGHCRETQAGTGPGECAGPGGLSGPSTCGSSSPAGAADPSGPAVCPCTSGTHVSLEQPRPLVHTHPGPRSR